MGKIDVRFDEKTEALIKDEAAKMKMNVSDFIRYKLNLKDSSVDQIILSFMREFQQQRVEILEMRKELRLSVGAMIEVLKAHGVTIEEMKQAGLEFFKKSGVKI